MLRTALIGVGGMGRGHLANLIQLTKEGDRIKLVAACDVDPERFENKKVDFNLDVGGDDYDFSKFNCYTDMDDMLAKEKLDLVVIALPTYLHCPATVKCLKLGINVFCEKPMALSVEECDLMINTAKECGKHLMIGQCLRFWGEYAAVKQIIDSGRLGKPHYGYFWRGGDTPKWSFENWLLRRECGGGALHDQHVHDVDTVAYLFGMPKQVTTLGRTVYPGSGYDSVSTQYIYDDGKVVNAQDDWTLNGTGFAMEFRVGFEKGCAVMANGKFNVYDENQKDITPEFNTESAYVTEMKYFADCILKGTKNTINPPEASRDTIRIVAAETKSADNRGKLTDV